MADQAGPTSRRAEQAMVVGGLVIGSVAAALLSIIGAFLTPVRAGTVLIPVSLVIAVVGNIAVTWFTHAVTRRTWLSLLPGAVWVVVAFAASIKTTEGDLILVAQTTLADGRTQANWVSTTYLLVGAITIGMSAYRLILPRGPAQPGTLSKL